MSLTKSQYEQWETEVDFWRRRFIEADKQNAKLVAALRITRANNGALIAAFMLKLREENKCNGPCADNQKCGCWGEMQNYIALANQ